VALRGAGAPPAPPHQPHRLGDAPRPAAHLVRTAFGLGDQLQRARRHRLERQLELPVLPYRADHQHAGGSVRHDGGRRAQAVQPRHVDVHGDHVGPQGAGLLHGLHSVGGLADDGEVRILAEQGAERGAQCRRVVGDQHADGLAVHAAPLRRAITELTSESSRPETQSFLVRNPSAPTARPRCRSFSESRAETSRWAWSPSPPAAAPPPSARSRPSRPCRCRRP